MRIFTVIVSYHPDVTRLGKLVARVAHEGCTVVVVDNTERDGTGWNGQLMVGCHTIALGSNFGVARAQNIGIQYALENGAEVVLYFDQDSVPEDGFVSALVTPLIPGQLAVVAPTYWNESNGREFPSHRLNDLGLLIKQYGEGRNAPYSADIVIASGMAATAETFRQVGLMDEDFFIDFVDTEWSLRCRSRGVRIQIVPTARMRHTIGGRTVGFGLIKLTVHSPERCYYQIRNGILLLRRKHIPLGLAVVELGKVLFFRALLLALVRPRLVYLSHYCLGIGHGLIGVVGKMPAN